MSDLIIKLNNRQAYTPSAYVDEAVEVAKELHKTHYFLIICDFNEKGGQRNDNIRKL